MNTFVKTLMTSALLLAPLSSHAITISLNPTSQTVTSGSSFDVALTISGLGNGVAPSLGAFDVDISFEQSILSFSSVTFSSFLGDLSLFEATTSFDDFSTPGIVNLFELSLLEGDALTCVFCIPPYLDDLQPSDFTLATLSFSALSAGSSALGVSLNALVDASGGDLTADLIGGSVNVNANGNPGSVPEPATWLLLGLGAISFRLVKRQI